ncbi:MAG: NUDIX domain-containing protein [Thermoplasmata archaeon]|nr:MAG: NUDIX domain-containing protein [Thermoplasmata archaeon]
MIEEAAGEVRIKGRGLSKGKKEGNVIKSLKPLSLARDVGFATSEILDSDIEIHGEPIKDRVLVFPSWEHSEGYTDTLTRLMKDNIQPAALVAESLDSSVIRDAVNAEVPAVDEIDISFLETGDDVTVNGTQGTVGLKNVTLKHIATSVIVYQGKILVLRRSDEVGTYQGRWACVSGYVEVGETADKTALREISEEIGLKRDDYEFRRKGKVLHARDKTMLWAIHPFLFETKKQNITLDWEHEEYKWILPKEIAELECVPKLKETIETVFNG